MSYDDEYEDVEEEAELTAGEVDEFEEAIVTLTTKIKDLDADALRTIAKKAGIDLAFSLRESVRSEVKKAVATACGKEIERLAQQHMREAFAEALLGQVAVGGTWDQKTMSIREVIRKEMVEAKNKLGDSYRRDDLVKGMINDFMSKELVEMAKAAVADYRQEILSQLTKEATARLTNSIAKALAGDPKLLRVIEAMEGK